MTAMKPTRDGEGVALAKTSENLLDPNMTQDEPEREEDGKLVARLRHAAWTVKEYGPRALGSIGPCDEAADLIERLQSELSTALVVSNNYQSLMVTAERERDEVTAEFQALWNCAVHEDKLKAAIAERNELRSSLARAVEALKQIVQFAAEGRNLAVPLEQARLLSALHRSQGE